MSYTREEIREAFSVWMLDLVDNPDEYEIKDKEGFISMDVERESEKSTAYLVELIEKNRELKQKNYDRVQKD